MRSFGVAFFHAYKNRPGLHRFSVKPRGYVCLREFLYLTEIQLDAPFRDIHYRSAAVGTSELGNISAREVESVAVGVFGECVYRCASVNSLEFFGM